jgi:hypothetical protein
MTRRNPCPAPRVERLTPGTPASGGLEQPARLPLRRAITETQGTQPAHQVVQFVFTGDRPVINYISQHAAGGGGNSSVAGGQAVQVGRNAVTAGQDVAVPGSGKQPVKEGWWARLRKRGAVVAVATIIGALAGLAGVVIAIMIAAGWKP